MIHRARSVVSGPPSDQVNDGPSAAVDPRAGKGKIRAIAVFQAQDLGMERDGTLQISWVD